ncbi:MAG: hypothetical protein A2134_02690 [Candidatus Woykebacteria bacterium RBG_16_39_9b]|uniref:LysM domain-containing protein n=1 Tax=Candidatus Woykebacteria bacterium RBG_16_39_9b TaxID=1802595 RepID=A0A1G1WEM8_9BACT|nr:MAG: hypothetical protein A2134_02690 [Candidatus Woykebacteria bacterium RBG_16_39_9b]
MIEGSPQSNLPDSPSSLNEKPFSWKIILGMIGGAIIVIALGYAAVVLNIFEEPSQQTSNGEKNTTDTSGNDSTNKQKFCEQYGTFEVKKEDLFEEYETKPGDTLRNIAKNELNDPTLATEIIKVNPTLSRYEIDDELPYKLKLYLPNEKYDEEGITTYMKARGNIEFNKEKPMFGVNAPNSGTGPFIITDKIKDNLNGIKLGDCVEVVYGSKGFDPQKVVFEVKIQNSKN